LSGGSFSYLDAVAPPNFKDGSIRDVMLRMLMPISRGNVPKFDERGAKATSQQTQAFEHGARADPF
jgi:hypothetical protein